MSQTQSKRDVFAIVTEQIIDQLEAGTIPWRQPWKDAGPPRNLITGRHYRGVNTLVLNGLGYGCNAFLTLKQINALGGHVRKGEHATPVVFWSRKDEADDVLEKQQKKAVLRYYSVFNVDQCLHIPDETLHRLAGLEFNETLLEPLTVFEQMPLPPKLVHKGKYAMYFPATDTVFMPKIQSFEDSSAYYGVLFHEVAHATGHEKRLKREAIMYPEKFTGESYAEEELVAQIAACFLTAITGCSLKHFANDVAYIDTWLQRLRNDRRLLVFASAKAQRAVDYILNNTYHTAAIEKEEHGDVVEA